MRWTGSRVVLNLNWCSWNSEESSCWGLLPTVALQRTLTDTWPSMTSSSSWSDVFITSFLDLNYYHNIDMYYTHCTQSVGLIIMNSMLTVCMVCKVYHYDHHRVMFYISIWITTSLYTARHIVCGPRHYCPKGLLAIVWLCGWTSVITNHTSVTNSSQSLAQC